MMQNALAQTSSIRSGLPLCLARAAKSEERRVAASAKHEPDAAGIIENSQPKPYVLRVPHFDPKSNVCLYDHALPLRDQNVAPTHTPSICVYRRLSRLFFLSLCPNSVRLGAAHIPR